MANSDRPSGALDTAFPDDFLFGAALLAHQVEGGAYGSDWWRWEQRPGRIAGNANSQVAAGHFERYEEDFELARRLGLRGLFFSVSWSRVQPGPGAFDEAGVSRYREMLAALCRRGIEPLVVLYHGVSPDWFAARGGWTWPGAAAAFGDYAQRMAGELAPHCRWWLPFHEPMEALRMGFVEGAWPPGRRNPLAAWRAIARLREAHAAAYRAIHGARHDARAGVALRARCCLPADSDRSWDFHAARFQEAWPWRFIDDAADPLGTGAPRPVCVPLDFLGVGFHGSERIQFTPLRWRQFCARYISGQTRAGAEADVVPDAAAFARVLRGAARYGLPLLVTGNGIAADDDAARCRFLLDHLAAVGNACAEGLDIRGYFHRAFLDGFEWTQGYTKRYGLVHVARESLVRTPNPSAYLYRDICEAGRFRRGAIEKFCPGWPSSAEVPLR